MAELSTVQYFHITNRKNLYSLIIGLAVFLIILLMPTPTGLTVLGQRTLAIFVLVFVLWITEALPLPATALIPGILLFFLKIKDTPAGAFKSYAHPAVFFIIGSLIIAQGLVKSGLGKRITLGFLSKCRNSPSILLFMFIAISAGLGAFISDHLVAAMLLPVAILIVSTAKIEGKFKIALVLAIAFGSGIAGLATPSGGARNIVVLGFLEEMAGESISYLDWMIAGVPITLIMIPIVWVMLRLAYSPQGVDLKQAIETIRSEIQPMSSREWKALLVFLFTLIMFITTSDLIGLGTIAIIGAILMFLTGVIDWVEAEKGVNWGVMFIYGAAITMGLALKDTGAAEWLARGFIVVLPQSSPLLIVFGIVVITAILTEVMSDGATASVLGPITLNLALISAIEPRLMALATAIPCAFAYLTVFGSPRNTIVYGSGYFRPRELLKVGFFMKIATIMIMFLIVKYYWTWLGLW